MSLYYGDPVVGGAAAGTGTIIPGHEPAGVVEAVGPGVASPRPGDRVAVYLALGCGRCAHCRAGHLMLCPTWQCIGFDVHGGNADYLVVPAGNCLGIPDEMSFEVAAVSTDCIGTLYSAQKRLAVSGRDTLAVFGMGPMGAAGVMVGRANGARVVAIDVVAGRLELARALGADEVVDASAADPVARVRELTAGQGATVAIDCSGSAVCESQALDCTAPLGRVAFIGENREATIRPSDQLIRKQLSLCGSWYFPIHEYDEIARFILAHRLPVDRLISHRFPLREAAEAFTLFDQRRTLKVVFTWD
jgi:propanol-preferring alcohol dehydrogenase